MSDFSLHSDGALTVGATLSSVGALTVGTTWNALALTSSTPVMEDNFEDGVVSG